jgi:hypothetical protein
LRYLSESEDSNYLMTKGVQSLTLYISILER